jgi:hypothetical protein
MTGNKHRIRLHGDPVAVGPDETPADLRDGYDFDRYRVLVYETDAGWIPVPDDTSIAETVPEDAICGLQPQMGMKSGWDG